MGGSVLSEDVTNTIHNQYKVRGGISPFSN